MTGMEIFQLLVGSGTLLGIGAGLIKIGRIVEKVENIEKKLDVIESHISSINTRLSRLEGAFQERGYWESRKTGTEKDQ